MTKPLHENNTPKEFITDYSRKYDACENIVSYRNKKNKEDHPKIIVLHNNTNINVFISHVIYNLQYTYINIYSKNKLYITNSLNSHGIVTVTVRESS